MAWYYAKDGRSRGPVEEAELKALLARGTIAPGDLVWNESMGDKWMPAGDVPGLCGGARPPPVPSAAAAPGIAEPSDRVSCVAPVAPAWQGMKERLFRPFSMAGWFGLGVSAWLASLGQSQGGGAFNWNWRGDRKLPEDWDWRSETGIGEALGKAGAFVEQHGATLAWIVAAGVAAAVAFGLLILWLRCHGKFMLLDNVVSDTAEVRAPWTTFKQHAGSLFKWNIGYVLVCFVALLPILALVLMGGVAPCIRSGRLLPSATVSLSLAGLLLAVYALATSFVSRFLEDFVIPIMYNLDLTATEAWGRFLPLLRKRFWGFVLYGFFYAVLSAAAGAFIVMLAVVTCCVAGCLMLLPVVGAVVTLPVPVFFRLYSVGYLAQFGGDFSLPVVRQED